MQYKSKQEVLRTIGSLPGMANLPVNDYSEEGGLADSFVVGLKEDREALKATQLRRFFHQIKFLQRQVERSNDASFDRTGIAQVMPVLAYAAGRALIPKDFYELMKLCFGQQKCRTKADFLSAANFLEAVMAYHKYHN